MEPGRGRRPGRRPGRRGPAVRWSPRPAAAVLAGLRLILLGPGLLVTGTAAAEPARPTADPAAPTPTAPLASRPPRGSAPDGTTVGGSALGTRGVVAPEDAPPLPGGTAAAGWLVADAGSGEVLAARDPHGRYYPASTLKTLTLLTLLPLLDPAQVVVATADDERVEGSRVGIVEGGRYPVGLLFQALVLQSGNDAANALARTAGGTATTLAAMNDTAARLGAFDTVAGSPSGLDVAGQSSSPYDLALIFRALLDDPAALEILRTPTAQIPPVPGRSAGYQIQNENPLLAGYPGALGGKTGFTDAAQHTFVGAAERDGRVLVVSVMDTDDVPLRAAEQAARLLDWGFGLPADVEGVGRLVDPGEVPAEPPRPSPASSGTTSPPSAAAAAGTPARAVEAAGPSGPGPALWPVGLGAGAVLIACAVLIARRRTARPPAARSVPAAPSARPAPPPASGSTGPGSPPPAGGTSPSTPP